MPWIQASSCHRSLVEAFIFSQEHYCANLSDKLLDSSRKRILIPAREQGSLFLELSGRVLSLYYIERLGFSFIIFNSQQGGSPSAMRRLITPQLKHLFSCMGRKNDCDLFMEIFNIRPSHRQNYLMMNRREEHSMLNPHSTLQPHRGENGKFSISPAASQRLRTRRGGPARIFHESQGQCPQLQTYFGGAETLLSGNAGKTRRQGTDKCTRQNG